MNGRHGQPQHGVDIYGSPAYGQFYAAVQCKDKNAQLGSVLTKDELVAEAEKAESFRPRVAEFTMATTAARDASLQKYARDLGERDASPFKVFVWSWDDIEEEIRCRPRLLHAYYPDVEIAPHDQCRVNTSFISHRDQCQAFFSRPEVMRRFPQDCESL